VRRDAARTQTTGRFLTGLLTGRVPGVRVTRGAASFVGHAEPPYVVDGLSLPPGTSGAPDSHDVERIEVLKSPLASPRTAWAVRTASSASPPGASDRAGQRAGARTVRRVLRP
jgi:hypothetical protein